MLCAFQDGRERPALPIAPGMHDRTALLFPASPASLPRLLHLALVIPGGLRGADEADGAPPPLVPAVYCARNK